MYPKHFMCIISFSTHNNYQYDAQSSDEQAEAYRTEVTLPGQGLKTVINEEDTFGEKSEQFK